MGGYLWDIFGISLGYLWDIFGISLGYLWDIFGTSLRYLRDIFGISFVGAYLRSFSGHFWACWHSLQAVPDLHWAKKRHFGPKRSLLRSLAAQKRPNISPKCVVTMIPTQTEQPVSVVTKYGPRRPPRASRA